MISLLGRSLVLLALAVCVIGAVLGMTAGHRRSLAGNAQARTLAWIFGLAMVAATGLMELALITHDFSVGYVAQVGSRTSPVHITIVSLWSSLEGSILFWGLIQGLYTVAFARSMGDRHPQQAGYALGALLAVGVFFSFLIAGVADPFMPVDPVPADGPGPNPLLQNHWLMIIHPPTLYLGFVGMSVPFAMAVAALLSGTLDAAWIRLLRQWMLVVWAWLTLGILLGGWWSYEVLGWGGYWAWDPVENASFMPWLTATAFLHSAMITERTGKLRGWTLVLALATFLLTLLGTFMTRSGVFNSVHSFTQSDIGPVFLAFIAVVLVASVLLLGARLDVVDAGSEPVRGPVTRETVFLLNNLVLVAFTFTVLVGTLYPLANEALNGEQVSVGAPYFNQMTLPLCVALLFLMGVGPALPWGRPDFGPMLRRLAVPAGVAVAASVVAGVLGTHSPWALLTVLFGVFTLGVSAQEVVSPGRARAASKGESLPAAVFEANKRARRRFAAHVVHTGTVILALGVAFSGAYRQEIILTFPKGQSVAFAGYDLTFREATSNTASHRTTEAAVVEVSRDGRSLAELAPAMNHYKAMGGNPIGTPAVLSTWRQDLYLSLVRIEPGARSAAIQVVVQPLIVWIWLGGLVMFGGALLGALPSLRRAGAVAARAAAAK